MVVKYSELYRVWGGGGGGGVGRLFTKRITTKGAEEKIVPVEGNV